MNAFELTQTVKQGVQLWVGGTLKSTHLSEGEAISKASLLRRREPLLRDAKFQLRMVGAKDIDWIDDPEPVPVPTPTPEPVAALEVTGEVGKSVKLGYTSSDPAIAVASGESDVAFVGEGTAILTPVIR